MKILTHLLSTACLLGSVLSAGSLDKSFVMTAREPVIAGNTVLAAGTYVWKLLDSPSNLHIVEISNQKTGHVETTILALPKYRAVASQTNEVHFWETPSGVPPAVHTWFYPGDNFGQEFAYPKELIASFHPVAAHQALLVDRSVAAVLPPQSEPAKPLQLARVHAPVAKLATAALPAEAQQGSWAVVGGGAAAPTPAKHSHTIWDSVKNLPFTATLAPLIGLIGLVSLALFLMSYLKRHKQFS